MMNHNLSFSFLWPGCICPFWLLYLFPKIFLNIENPKILINNIWVGSSKNIQLLLADTRTEISSGRGFDIWMNFRYCVLSVGFTKVYTVLNLFSSICTSICLPAGFELLSYMKKGKIPRLTIEWGSHSSAKYASVQIFEQLQWIQ